MDTNSTTSKGHAPDLVKFAERVGTLTFGVSKELWIGLRYNLIPWNACLAGGTVCCLLFLAGKDRLLFEWLYVGKLYPTRPYWLIGYWSVLVTSSFWAWAFYRWAKKLHRNRELERVFSESGLRSSQGRVPSLIFDKQYDEYTKTLRVTVAGATLEKFKKARGGLESNFKIFIDDIRENRRRGTVDIIYSEKEMPRHVELKNVHSISPCKFLIGETRASIVKADIRKVPHILIAGQTGGGKSSFLRQFITTHLLNCKHSHFILIDLKEGLESHLFEGISNAEVFEDVAKASNRLGRFEEKLPERLNSIKAAGCLDYDGYIASGKAKVILERVFIVVDEAAELFKRHRPARTCRRCSSHYFHPTPRFQVSGPTGQSKFTRSSLLPNGERCFQHYGSRER